MGCDECLMFTDTVKALSDLDKMNKEVIIPFDLPYAPNNNALFKKYGLGKRIPATLTEFANNEFDLVFNSFSDSSKKYSVSLNKNLSDWVKCAANTKLCELDLGTVTHSTANILGAWNGDADGYEVGDSGVFPIYGNFGSQKSPETLTPADIRYAFSGLYLIREGLCKCGVSFVSPVLEAYPHLWGYWLKKKWWENSGHGTNVRFRTVLSADTGTVSSPDYLATVIPQDGFPTSQPVDDPGGTISFNSDPTPYYLHSQVVEVNGCVRMQGSVTNNTPPNQQNATFMYLRVVCDGGTFEYKIFANSFQTVEVDIEIPVTNFNNATFRVFQGGQWVFLEGFSIWFVPKDQHFYEGDILNKAEMLDCNKSVLDVLKAYAHLFNAKFDFNEATRELFMSCPYEIDGIEGYFKGMLHTKTLEKVVCDSRESSQQQQPEAIRIYCFASSNDPYVKERLEDGSRSDEEEEHGILSSYDNLGFDNDKTKKLCNPQFEPTLNDFQGLFQGGDALPLLPNGNLYTPQFLDNTEGKQSNCINPRIFYIFNGQQRVNGEEQEIYFNENPRSLYPTIYQELPNNVDIIGNADFARQQLGYQILYEKFYRKYLKRTAANIKDTFSLLVSYKEYKSASTRVRYRIRYDGLDFVGILKLKRFNSCGKVVKWEFVRENLDC